MTSHIKSFGINSRPKDLESVKKIQEFQQFSIQCKYSLILILVEQRICTDILCIIIGVLFSLIILVVSFAFYNNQHYYQANFPTDSDGRLCGLQGHQGYSYVYFAEPTKIEERICVSECPRDKDTKLNCKVTKTRGCRYTQIAGFQVQKYPTEAWQDRNGHFCMPTDQSARQIILQKSKLNSRNIFFNSIDTYITCSLLSAIFALVFFLIVQFFPKKVNKYIMYIGVVILFILVICTWTYPTEHVKPKIIIGLVLIGFLVVVTWTLYLFRSAIEKNQVFLNQSTKFIKDFPFVLINIPLFLVITALFTYILILELNSIWTNSDLEFESGKSLYWQYIEGQNGFLKFLWLIQAIWGLNFIKQWFNFIVSGYAVLWYNGHIKADFSITNNFSVFIFPYRLFLTKHLGSVIACSFMSAFLNVLDTIFDLARGTRNNEQGTICGKLDNFFDLVKSQAMAYITIAGNAYCNSARYCNYLQNTGDIDQGSQSVSKAYRISAYCTLSGFVAIIGLYIYGQISIYGIAVVIVFSYFIVNFFLQMHADAADAIMIIFLQNLQFQCRKFIGENNQGRSDFNKDQLRYNTRNKTYEIHQELSQENLYNDQVNRRKELQRQQPSRFPQFLQGIFA